MLNMAHIENLSPEILDIILFYLPAKDDSTQLPDATLSILSQPTNPSPLHLYSTVSKRWQYHFEKRLYNRLRIKSSELEDFSRIVRRGRRAALARLEFHVILPTYSEHACARFERISDQVRNNEAFTAAIQNLFQILKGWETDLDQQTDAGKPNPVVLDLSEIYSPMDGRHRGAERYQNDRLQWSIGHRRDLWEKRYEHSFIGLLDNQDLPSIARIVGLEACLYWSRKVAPSSIANIASRFPNLESIRWNLSDDEKKYPKVRRQMRYDFSQALLTVNQSSLKRIELEYYNESYRSHNFEPHSAILGTSPSTDHFSIALHALTQGPSITKISLSGDIVISPSLFWPDSDDLRKPYWPKLQELSVTFNSCAPDKKWYFTRHPDKGPEDDEFDEEGERSRAFHSESDTDSDSNPSEDSAIWDDYHPNRIAQRTGDLPARRFRFYPDDATILPLLKAMAKAAACMPALQCIDLSVGMEHDLHFEVTFLGRGRKRIMSQSEKNVDRYRLFLEVGSWRPDEELLKLWHAVVPGDGKDGGLIVEYLDEY